MAIRMCSQCKKMQPRLGVGRRSTWCEYCFTEWEIMRSDPKAQAKLYERFDAKVTEDFPCLIWTGAKGSTGYGSISVAGKTCYAHRVAYERYKGPIPLGLDIDRICRNRLCVNPDHLEAVPRTVNLSRGLRGRGPSRSGTPVGRRAHLPAARGKDVLSSYLLRGYGSPGRQS